MRDFLVLHEQFTETSWLAAMMGHGIAMTGRNAVADTLKPAALGPEIGQIEKSVRYLVKRLPPHRGYLAHYCPLRA